MASHLTGNQRFAIVLALVALLHILVLSIPTQYPNSDSPRSRVVDNIRVYLQPPDPQPSPEREPDRTDLPELPEYLHPTETVIRQPEPVPVEKINVPPSESLISRVETDAAEEPVSSSQILSTQFDYQKRVSVFGTHESEDASQPDFVFRSRSNLDDVLNAPSLQLPFRDQRVYLLDSYSPGLSGSVERFFDTVTVPFGWKTKNNTRIQCAWVLIIAACGWGHVSLFEKKARKRKPVGEEEN